MVVAPPNHSQPERQGNKDWDSAQREQRWPKVHETEQQLNAGCLWAQPNNGKSYVLCENSWMLKKKNHAQYTFGLFEELCYVLNSGYKLASPGEHKLTIFGFKPQRYFANVN